MLTPLSITSLDQGKDLARWHMSRLYGEAINPDTDRAEADAEIPVPVANASVAAVPARRSLLAMLIARWCGAWPTNRYSSHGKSWESSAI